MKKNLKTTLFLVFTYFFYLRNLDWYLYFSIEKNHDHNSHENIEIYKVLMIICDFCCLIVYSKKKYIY